MQLKYDLNLDSNFLIALAYVNIKNGSRIQKDTKDIFCRKTKFDTSTSLLNKIMTIWNILSNTLNRRQGSVWTLSPFGFSKNIFFGERVKSCFFVTFNNVINDTFRENFTDIPQVGQKKWSFPYSILTIFINFLNFLTFPCYKETNEASLLQMMSAWFYFQPTSDRLLNNCIKLYCY